MPIFLTSHLYLLLNWKHLKLTYQVKGKGLSLSSIYAHFNSLKKKKKTLEKTLWKKMKLLILSNFIFFHYVFYAICVFKSFKSHFQLSSAASLNLGWSQNGVLGNGLIWAIPKFCHLVHKVANKSCTELNKFSFGQNQVTVDSESCYRQLSKMKND